MDLYSASSRSASNALLLPVSWRRSLQASPTARHQLTLRDYRYGLVYHVICLFTPPAYARYSFSLGRLRLSNLGAWFHTEVVYLSKDSHLPRY